MAASRSWVSHQNGSSGAIRNRTVPTIDAWEAMTDHSARTVSADAPCTRSTNRSLFPPSQRYAAKPSSAR